MSQEQLSVRTRTCRSQFSPSLAQTYRTMSPVFSCCVPWGSSKHARFDQQHIHEHVHPDHSAPRQIDYPKPTDTTSQPLLAPSLTDQASGAFSGCRSRRSRQHRSDRVRTAHSRGPHRLPPLLEESSLHHLLRGGSLRPRITQN